MLPGRVFRPGLLFWGAIFLSLVASGFSRKDVSAIGVGVVVLIWLASAFGLSATGVASVAGGIEACLEILFLAPLRAHLGAPLPNRHRAVQFLVLQLQLEPVLAPVLGVPGHDDHLVAVDRARTDRMLIGLAPTDLVPPFCVRNAKVCIMALW